MKRESYYKRSNTFIFVILVLILLAHYRNNFSAKRASLRIKDALTMLPANALQVHYHTFVSFNRLELRL